MYVLCLIFGLNVHPHFFTFYFSDLLSTCANVNLFFFSPRCAFEAA